MIGDARKIDLYVRDKSQYVPPTYQRGDQISRRSAGIAAVVAILVLIALLGWLTTLKPDPAWQGTTPSPVPGTNQTGVPGDR